MSVNTTLGDTQLILTQCQRQGLLRNQAAYVLATAWWETAHTRSRSLRATMRMR